MNKSPYTVLHVRPDADMGAIKEAFRALARQLHPDVNPAPEAADRMREANEAYALLSDPLRRARYDATCPSTPFTDDRNEKDKPTAMNHLSTEITRTTDTTLMETPRRAGEIAIPMPVVPQSFHQLGLFVLDGSGSMTEAIGGMSKADAVNGALREVFTRFKVSRNKANFAFAAVAFDEDADTLLGITDAGAVDDNADYNPLEGRGGGTFIGSGLAEAKKLAEGFLKNARPDIPASVVIVVMSDGQCGDPAATTKVADTIKRMERVTLCATHFTPVGKSDPAAQATLKAIATDPVRGYKTVYDAESLRAFFVASVSAGRHL